PEYLAAHPRAAGYVTGLYQDLLGRAPAAAELPPWVDLLQGGASPQQVALAVLTSSERATAAVNALYLPVLRRQADPVGVAAFTPLLQTGASLEAVADIVFGSPEYFNLPH